MIGRIEQSWKEKLEDEFGKPYMQRLIAFVEEEYKKGEVYPEQENIFRAFELTPFDAVKVVILGQDPYHGAGQATGLSFGVPGETKLPPSLRNIYKELKTDLEIETKGRVGDLSPWATQGVLLLNATLTVRAGAPGSHQKKGWEEFTDAVIQTLSNEREHLVFILWGAYARNKGRYIDRTKHHIIESTHPSPFSANNGFFGSKPFSATNTYLTEQGIAPIAW